jgi:hypothetical protein
MNELPARAEGRGELRATELRAARVEFRCRC